MVNIKSMIKYTVETHGASCGEKLGVGPGSVIRRGGIERILVDPAYTYITRRVRMNVLVVVAMRNGYIFDSPL